MQVTIQDTEMLVFEEMTVHMEKPSTFVLSHVNAMVDTVKDQIPEKKAGTKRIKRTKQRSQMMRTVKWTRRGQENRQRLRWRRRRSRRPRLQKSLTQRWRWCQGRRIPMARPMGMGSR